MPKIAKELSALEVGRLTRPGLYAVGGVSGLQLQVTASGARSWVLRARVGSKRRDIGLGGYPSVTLAGAREAARAARAAIVEGTDPVEQRQQARRLLAANQAKLITFKKAAEQYIEAHRPAWKNAKHAAQWGSTLETYAYPVIGKMIVGGIESGHVLRVLQPIWKDKTETAQRVRGRIGSVLDWAKGLGYRSGDNPAAWRGSLKSLLPEPGKVTEPGHHAAVALDDMHAFMQALRQREGVAARALEFLTLTATRSGEVRGMRWAELDTKTGVWVVPKERMKAGEEHRVPLSRQALKVLQGLPHVDGQDLVFPGTRETGGLSDMALTAVMRRMEVKAVPHGLRSSFRDWAGDRTNFPRDLAEHALAHKLKDAVEAAYRRSTALERRRVMMQAWADFIDTPVESSGAVIPLRVAG